MLGWPDGQPRQAAYGGQRKRHRTDIVGGPALAQERHVDCHHFTPGSPCRTTMSRTLTAACSTNCQTRPCSLCWLMPGPCWLPSGTITTRFDHTRNLTGRPPPRSLANVARHAPSHAAKPSSTDHEGARLFRRIAPIRVAHQEHVITHLCWRRSHSLHYIYRHLQSTRYRRTLYIDKASLMRTPNNTNV